MRSWHRHCRRSDRRKAIDLAFHKAGAGDIVLIAGKGHEKTQTTREGVAPFDDVECRPFRWLNEMGYAGVAGS